MALSTLDRIDLVHVTGVQVLPNFVVLFHVSGDNLLIPIFLFIQIDQFELLLKRILVLVGLHLRRIRLVNESLHLLLHSTNVLHLTHLDTS